MSILIKGMEMPKAGELLQVAENVDGTIFVRETTHEEWHQVIVVPTPHGDLVDSKRLMEDAIELDWSNLKWVNEITISNATIANTSEE